jgi:DeoR/GlpR family transcriptional regulator of sugar metabolism
MAKERVKRITELLNKVKVERRTTIDALAGFFGVSTATVRRDLKELQQQEDVVQTVGGGVEYRGGLAGPESADTIDVHVPEKIRIAEYLTQLVGSFDDLLIGPGTTTLLAGRILSGITDRRFRIITNSIELALETMELANIETVLLGGRLWNKHSLGYPHHQDYLDHCNPTHKLIMSADGVDAEHGATIFETAYVPILRKMISVSQEVILAADSSKFDRVCFTTVVEAAELSIVVTDTGAPENAVRRLESRGVTVVRV